MRRDITVWVAVCITALALIAVGCGKKETAQAPSPYSTSQTSTEPTAKPTSSPTPSKVAYAIVEVEGKGKFVIELNLEKAPKTAGNFIKLAEQGFYNGLTFHRVVPDFVVQGGDPNGNGTGGPGYTIPFENTGLKHEDGAVAMALNPGDKNSAGSQFYICLGPQHQLDGDYAVFGKVIQGMDVVRKIQQYDIMREVKISRTKPQ